jgi:apolipoprotein N-acyltransferase
MNEAKAGSRRWPTMAVDSTLSYLAWGALSALGRPGIDLSVVFIAMVGMLLYGSITARSTLAASARALLFAVGAATPIAIGAQSWGWLVPLGMTVVCAAFYMLPLALLTRWTFLRVTPRYGVLFVGLVWSLHSSLLGALDVPLACMSQALAASAPSLLGGARLVGTAITEGGMTATLFAVAAGVAWSRGGDARARIRKASRPLLLGLGGLVALSGFARLSAPPSDGEVRVGIVQVNAGAEYHGARLEIPAMQRAFDRQLEGLLAQLTDVELVVMPETFDGRYTLMLPALRDAWSARARKWHQAYLLTSYLSEGGGLKSNAAGLIDAQGALTGIHRKVVLAPYGERGLAAGSVYRALPLDASTAVGVTICQESMSGLAMRSLTEAGAALLIGASSDISFGSSLVPFEHLAATRLRAIESGRSIVWASNAGPSGVIDRWGSSAALAPFRRAVVVKTTAELHRERTPYFRLHRHWLALLLLAVCALGGLIRREGPPEPKPAIGEAPPRSWWAALPAVGILALALLTMPILVELRHGSRPRALAAVVDLWSSQATVPFRGNLERFYTPPERSYAGAVALFVSYYGQELGRDDVPTPRRRGIEGVQELLRERYRVETRVLRLGEVLPQSAALVELTDGSFGVLALPTGQSGWLLSPDKHTVGPIGKELRAGLRGQKALVPTGVLGTP